MRIIGGKARGFKLRMVKSGSTRPTSDRVKESLFNILGQNLSGESLLDLFSGVGSIGLEALSRGAGRVVMVDADRDCCRVTEHNLRQSGLERGRTEILNTDFKTALMSLDGPFDLIFMDPPYARASEYAEQALRLIEDRSLLAPEGLVIVEHDRTYAEGRRQAWRRKKYGQTYLSFYRRKQDEQ